MTALSFSKCVWGYYYTHLNFAGADSTSGEYLQISAEKMQRRLKDRSRNQQVKAMRVMTLLSLYGNADAHIAENVSGKSELCRYQNHACRYAGDKRSHWARYLHIKTSARQRRRVGHGQLESRPARFYGEPQRKKPFFYCNGQCNAVITCKSEHYI